MRVRISISRSAALLILVAVAGFAGGAAFAQIANLVLVKPWSTSIVWVSADLRAVNISFSYNPLTNRYTSAEVLVMNYNNNQSLSGTVYIVLMDQYSNILAQGNASTGPIAPGAAVLVTVPLTWVNGTVSDLAVGRIVIA